MQKLTYEAAMELMALKNVAVSSSTGEVIITGSKGITLGDGSGAVNEKVCFNNRCARVHSEVEHHFSLVQYIERSRTAELLHSIFGWWDEHRIPFGAEPGWRWGRGIYNR